MRRKTLNIKDNAKGLPGQMNLIWRLYLDYILNLMFERLRLHCKLCVLLHAFFVLCGRSYGDSIGIEFGNGPMTIISVEMHS